MSLGSRVVGLVVLSLAIVNPAAAQTTTRVSVATGGVEATGAIGSYETAISADGRFVAFSSTHVDLVAGDTNNLTDIFVHDRLTGQTTRVSVATGGGQGLDGDAFDPAISADGRYVAFESSQTNLVAGDTNGHRRRLRARSPDRQTTTRQRGVERRGGHRPDGRIRIAAAGHERRRPLRRVRTRMRPTSSPATPTAWTMSSSTIARPARRSRQRGPGGAQANDDSFDPTITPDGRFVVVPLFASNLVAGDTNDRLDVFLWDRNTGQTDAGEPDGDGSRDQRCLLHAVAVRRRPAHRVLVPRHQHRRQRYQLPAGCLRARPSRQRRRCGRRSASRDRRREAVTRSSFR